MWLQISFHLSCPLLLFHFIRTIESKDKTVSSQHTRSCQACVAWAALLGAGVFAVCPLAICEFKDCPLCPNASSCAGKGRKLGALRWFLWGVGLFVFKCSFYRSPPRLTVKWSTGPACPPASPHQQPILHRTFPLPREQVSAGLRCCPGPGPGPGPAARPLPAITLTWQTGADHFKSWICSAVVNPALPWRCVVHVASLEGGKHWSKLFLLLKLW